MRVSIIIPTFNRANYLEDAISSALAQDYADLEVVVSDNASSDNTELVSRLFLKNPKFRYFKNTENIGMVPNWHKAVFERITGDWFLILSDDDILTNPHFISQAVQLIKASPDITVVYSNSYIYDQALNTVTPLRVPFKTVEEGILVFSKRGTVYPQDFALCNILFNKKLSRECNAFSNPVNLSCDTELFLHLCLRGKVGVVKEYCSLYRIHSENLLKTVSKNLELIRGSLDSLVKPLLDAQRQGVSEKILLEFVANSQLRKEVMVAILKTSSSNKEKAKVIVEELRDLFGEKNYGVLPGRFLFCVIVACARMLMPMLVWRRKALYMWNSTKRHIFGRQTYFKPLHRKVYYID